MKLKPGEISVGPPEYVGAFPVRTEIEILPTPEPRVDREMAEHGSCLIRFPIGVYDDTDNTFGEDYHPKEGDAVMVRAANGGWWVCARVVVKQTPYVRCGKTDVPLVFDEKRGRWAVRELV